MQRHFFSATVFWVFAAIAPAIPAAAAEPAAEEPKPAKECALCKAADKGKLAEVNRLLASGASPDMADDSGNTPLMRAAQSGHAEVIKILINNGADLEANNNGALALVLAAEQGHTEAAKILLNNDIPPDGEAESGTALLAAATYGHVKLGKLLLINGANPHALNNQSITPLVRAAVRGHAGFIELLQDNDVDLLGANKNFFPSAALYNVGAMLYDGKLGGDEKESFGWFHKAAVRGIVEAQFITASLYFSGDGGIENEYESYVWLSVAAENGSAEAAEFIRDTYWGFYLTTQKIYDAKREAVTRAKAIRNRTYRPKIP
ncbi:MAG: ankyrin repeat domain-containing protein [Gammaproteobacteria bacterium]